MKIKYDTRREVQKQFRIALYIERLKKLTITEKFRIIVGMFGGINE